MYINLQFHIIRILNKHECARAGCWWERVLVMVVYGTIVGADGICKATGVDVYAPISEIECTLHGLDEHQIVPLGSYDAG